MDELVSRARDAGRLPNELSGELVAVAERDKGEDVNVTILQTRLRSGPRIALKLQCSSGFLATSPGGAANAIDS